MKKLLAAALLAALCLCGCGDKSTEAPSQSSAQSTAEVSSAQQESAVSAGGEENAAESSSELKGVFAQVKESVELPEMAELNDKLLERYYGLSSDEVSDYAGGVASSGVNQDEVVLIKAADDSQVETIRAALQTRYDSKLAQQENYNADEAEKIRNCEVAVNGSYVTLIISNDAAAISDIVNSALS